MYINEYAELPPWVELCEILLDVYEEIERERNEKYRSAIADMQKRVDEQRAAISVEISSSR